MPIFRLSDDDIANATLVIAPKIDLELERHLESLLESSPFSLVEDEPILWIGRQTSAQDENGTLFSDLLGIDFQGNLVVVELKKGRTPRDIVAQLLDYAVWGEGLLESQVREIAEIYFETRPERQGRTFEEVFREEFDMSETDELPPLNQKQRLFIVAEDIPPRVTRVCRYLRTCSINVSCIDVSMFQTESGETLISTETTVGDDGFAAAKTGSPGSESGDKLASQVVKDAVEELTQGNTEAVWGIKDVKAIIRKTNPAFNENTINGNITAECVNHPSRRHHPFARNEFYWRIERGKYRLYDPQRDKHVKDEVK